jgi:hypothetical protein
MRGSAAGQLLSSTRSRLARNGRDWHHLLELCGLVGARVFDVDGMYDPSHPNDRLLLGLKGTMSDAIDIWHRTASTAPPAALAVASGSAPSAASGVASADAPGDHGASFL